jgi:DNA repair exonuclease SbcCD ATPase subunit
MPDQKEELKKKIAGLLKQIADLKTAGKDLRNDPTARQARKTLKRAQRRLRLLTPMPLEKRLERVGKLTEMLSKRLGELTQGQKKVQANPYVRSIKKKTKSLNKLKKGLERKQKKAAASAPPAAPAAAAKPAEGQA